MEFKNAPDKKTQEAVLKKYGIRWSELFRLRYWDPTKFVVIEGMHNLFLGLAQHHMRKVLGGDVVKDESQAKPIRIANVAEIELARTIWAEGIRNKTHLGPVNMPGLQALCQEHGIAVACAPGKKLRRHDLVTALLDATRPQPQRIAPTDVDLAELMPGLLQDNVACCRERIKEAPIADGREGMLGTREWRQLRKGIIQTRRPLWQESPPRDIGSKSQGKWKADQWRTAFEFDLPVALVLLWATDLDESASWDEDRKLQVVESTMLLATSLRWGTSNRTSPHHAELYTKNMRAYLATIRSLFPDRNLVPNHHNALYLGEMLLRFGPARGWWMFPFERVIGLLQKFNTNNKTGEISRT